MSSLGMAKPRKKTTRLRSTDWEVGQPLEFPASKAKNNIERLALEAVEEGLRGPFGAKQKKNKKK